MSDQNITNIYDFCLEEIKNYDKPEGIELVDGWRWSMKDHLRRSFLYLNSQFLQNNEDRKNRPFKNIILPIMNVQYRTIDFDVKDILIYVDNPTEDDFQSLIISKYHNTWAPENNIDTFIDRMITSYASYGGVLVKKAVEVTPEVVNLRNLAFCNQTNILADPFALRHKMSFAELRKANKNWGIGENGATTDIETLIGMVKKEGKKEVELFEVHGLMPKDWVEGNDDSVDYYDENARDVYQMHIVAFYKKDKDDSVGTTLYKKKYKDIDDLFKFLSRDEIEGRALGRGGIEELFEPQQWTNKNEINITEMLVSASKTIHWSDDPTFESKNNLSNVDNNEVLKLTQGNKIQQLDTFPRNLSVFNDSTERLQIHAQKLGAASDPLLGETPNAGTPFKLYEAQQMESKSPHIWRQGKIATFLDEIYRDWLLPHFGKEVSKEQIFMETLTADEMEKVANRVVKKKTNQFKKNIILAMETVDEELVEGYKGKIRADFAEKGAERFFKIFADSMKDKNLKAKTNITGKQKNLALLTDKVVGILRQYIATPQI
jgi:hypothetical protein